MDGSDNNYESFTKSISGYSHYSDAYEDFSLEMQNNNNTENNSNKKISKKNSFNSNKEILKKISKISNNKLHPIPEDTKENTEENKFTNSIDIQIKTSKEKSEDKISEIKEESKETKINILDDIKNINNISNINANNFNDISDINNTIDSKKFEEDLYSNKEDNNSSFFKKDSSIHNNNELSYHKNELENEINPKKYVSDELTKIQKKNIPLFDSNKEPLDTNSLIIKKKNTQQFSNFNFNSKKDNNFITNVLKKFKSNDILIKKDIEEKRRGSCEGFFYPKYSNMNSGGYRPKFDLKNIIKKAVVMNGKKGKIKSSILKNSNFEPNDTFNINIDNEFPINNIKFKNIQIDEINVNFLKKHLRNIDIESNIKPKNRYIQTLLELQNFYIDNSSVWVIKLSPDSRYLAAGCKSGKIKIYEIIGYNYIHFNLIYKKNDIIKYLNFINESPYKTLEKHKSDIIDLSWSPFYPNLLLSASIDHYVCLWDITLEGNNCLVKEYEHIDIVTSVSFNPYIKNIFISGSINTFVTVWKFNYYDNIINEIEDNNYIGNTISEKQTENIINENSEANIVNNYMKDMEISKIKKKKKKPEIKNNDNTFENFNNSNSYLGEHLKEVLDYFNLEHKITSISYFPDSSKIGVGTENGKIYVYNTSPRVTYNNNFFVSKKKFGFFHDGKKVTGIQFIDKIHAVITTCDSLVRLVDMSIGKILYQYIGSTHKYSMTRAYTDLSDDVIIVAGEDGYCHIWNLLDKDCKKGKKNRNYIKFKPYAKDLVECTLIADEKCYTNYMQKILKLTNKIMIISIIINGTSNGKLEILLNINELFSK